VRITKEGYQSLNEKLDEIQNTGRKVLTSHDVLEVCQEINALIFEARQIMRDTIAFDAECETAPGIDVGQAITPDDPDAA
jgi:hypothetical protein